MPKIKRTQGEKTSVEIIKLDIVKQRCISNKESLKNFINRLIREEMMKSDEYFSNLYFNGI